MKTEMIRRTVDVLGVGRVTCQVLSTVLPNGWRVDSKVKDARYADTARPVERARLAAVKRALGIL